MLVHRREVVRREVRAMTARELQDKGGGNLYPQDFSYFFHFPYHAPLNINMSSIQVGLFQLLLMIKTLWPENRSTG